MYMVRYLTVVLCVLSRFQAMGTTSAERGLVWQPARDSVYLQEVGRQIPTDVPVAALAVLDGRLYAGSKNGVGVLDGQTFAQCGGPAQAVRRMKTIGDALFVITDSGLHRLRDGVWQCLAPGTFNDLCAHLDTVYVAKPNELLFLRAGILVPTSGDAAAQEIRRITSYY